MSISQITVIQKNKNQTTLQYQNRLLEQRNRILSKENQQLLNRVQYLQIQSKSIKEKYQQKLDNMIRKEKYQINRILNNSIPQINQKVNKIKSEHLAGQIKVLQKLNYQKSSSKSLIKFLVEIISEILREKQNIKSQNRLSKFNQILNKRKNKHNEIKQLKSQTLHFIKQPPNSVESIYKIMEPVHCFYRALVRKVKRDQIRNQSLNQIFDEISDYIENKQNIKTKNLKMMKLQRQWQLGLGSQINLSQYSEQLTQRTNQTTEIRQSLMFKIANIK